MGESSQIGHWFTGKSVLITGVTGFMGKVLMEKLLRCCSDLDKIYVTIRPKRGKIEENRLKDIFNLPIFEKICTTRPDLLNKVEIINANMSKEGLDISAEDRQKLIDNVDVVFHYAANLRFEAELRESIEINVAGTQRLLDLCKEMKRNICFVHVSTAFCSADVDVFEEKVYDPPTNPQEIIKLVQCIPRETLIQITPELIKPHPNTYTYSKRLSESIVANEVKNLRVTIVRPSIVGPAACEPIPGWVDTFNGPMGIMIASGKGALRTMHCNGDFNSHIVPVDRATNAVIIAAWKLGRELEKPDEVPVYNLTYDEIVNVPWKEVLQIGRKLVRKHPFEMQMWYPNGLILSNYKLHFVWSIFVHWLPAVLIDTLMLVIRQKTFMISIQKRIFRGLELMQFFSTRNWKFRSQNFIDMSKELKGIDKKNYVVDVSYISLEQYIETSILGARQYCLKESLTTIPRCKLIQNIFYILDTMLKSFILYAVYYIIWSKSSTFRKISSTIKNYVKIVPYLIKTYMKHISICNS